MGSSVADTDKVDDGKVDDLGEANRKRAFDNLDEKRILRDPVRSYPPPSRYNYFPNAVGMAMETRRRFYDILGPCWKKRVNIATEFFETLSAKDPKYTKVGGFTSTAEYDETSLTPKIFRTNSETQDEDIRSNVVVSGAMHVVGVPEDYFSKFLKKDWHFYSKRVHIANSSFTKAELTGILAYGSMYKADFINCTLVGEETMSIVELAFLLRFTDNIYIDIKGLKFPKNWLESLNQMYRISHIKHLTIRHVVLDFETRHLTTFLKKHVEATGKVEFHLDRLKYDKFRSKRLTSYLRHFFGKTFVQVYAEDFEKAEGNKKVTIYTPKKGMISMRFVEIATASKKSMKMKGTVKKSQNKQVSKSQDDTVEPAEA